MSNKIHVKHFYVVFPTLFALIATLTSQFAKQNDLRAIRLKVTFQMMGKDSAGLLNGGFSYNIVSYKGLTLYYSTDTLIGVKSYSETSGKPDTVKIPGSIFFVFQEKQKHGLLFTSLEDKKPRIVNADSALNAMLSLDSKMFDVEDGILVYKNTVGDSAWHESYCYLNKKDASYPDTMNLFFSDELKEIKFSLSPNEERARNKKLVKAEFVYNPYYDQTQLQQMPGRKMSFEISPVELAAPQKFVTFFEAAEKTILLK